MLREVRVNLSKFYTKSPDLDLIICASRTFHCLISEWKPSLYRLHLADTSQDPRFGTVDLSGQSNKRPTGRSGLRLPGLTATASSNFVKTFAQLGLATEDSLLPTPLHGRRVRLVLQYRI